MDQSQVLGKTVILNEDQNSRVDDETAVAHHSFKGHPQPITAKTSLPENYFVQSVERPITSKLDTSEKFLD